MKAVALFSVMVWGVGCKGGAGATDAALPDADTADAARPDAAQPDAASIDAPQPPEGHYQYVFDQIFLPTTATLANQYSFNVDSDPIGRPDNAFGQILSTIVASSDLDIQAGMNARIASGDVLDLADVEATSLVAADGVHLRTFLGEDADVPPNPADNFSGTETFVIRADSPTDSDVAGVVTAGHFDLGPGELTIELVGFAGEPLVVPLIGARVAGDITADGIANGKLGGGIPEEKLDEVIIPSLAEGLQASIDAECAGAPPNCCPPGSSGETLLDLFDENNDCTITLVELQDNSLISSLLAPDVDLLDSNNGNVFSPRTDGIKDSLSLGIGFTAVGANFALP